MNLNTELRNRHLQLATRRHFLRGCGLGLGATWLAGRQGMAAEYNSRVQGGLHFAPRAKRVIYLHMAGSPSQLELFDYKPELQRLDGQDCPQSFLQGKRFAFIQGVPKMLGPQYAFEQVGESGSWV